MEEIQARLNTLTLAPEEFKSALPPPVAARVEALEKLQDDYDQLEEAYKKERRELEAKYQTLYAPLYSDRTAIVKGDKHVEGADAAGIPNFWQMVLMRCDVTRDIMNEKDPDVLRYLTDITCETLEPSATASEEEEAQGGFKLQFTFDENPYFTNKVLEKTYVMMDDDEPVLEKSIGTDINWKPGKNVTVKLMKKKPKKGAKPDAKPLTKTEPVDSFFNFFTPPVVPEEDAELEEEEIEQLHEEIENDYEMGDMIRSRLIPHAVRWFTGEAVEDDDEFDDDMLGEDEDEEEEGEGEEGGEGPPRRKPKGKGRAGAAAAAAGAEQECKQQ